MTDAVATDPTTGAENVVWDLSHLYAEVDDPQIAADRQRLTAKVNAFVEVYKGNIATLDAPTLSMMLSELAAIYDLKWRLSSFASLSFAADTADPKIGALNQSAMEFGAKIDQQLVFFNLEWNAVSDDAVDALLQAPELASYQHFLESMRRFKPYQLSEAEERVLLEKSVTGKQAWTRLFTQMMSKDRYTFDGEEINASKLRLKLFDADRDMRRRAADMYTEGLHAKSMELAFIFNVLAADKASTDAMRGYKTWVSSRNLSNKAPDTVVDALVTTVTNNYDLVSRHYTLKRVLLGIDELFDYDRYAPLPLETEEKRYTWDEARTIVLDSFAAFDPEMADVARRFFDENWIHAAPLPDKRGGAFASPVVPSVHPYIFVNYNGTANNVMTLAHELGHGIHMVLSGKHQGIFGLSTPLTTAEMASTFAEMLVFNALLDAEDDPLARLALLVSKVEDSFGTVFRQVSMNRFEHGMHTARRTEGELTHARFGDIWMETQTAMYGDSVTLRDEYRAWWSYVPHFLHTPGYVYAYAFGELLVLALFNLYLEQGDDFVPRYLDVLRAGNSDYPDKILATLGVDLNDPGFWQNGIDAIADLISREEALAREVYPERF